MAVSYFERISVKKKLNVKLASRLFRLGKLRTRSLKLNATLSFFGGGHNFYVKFTFNMCLACKHFTEVKSYVKVACLNCLD